MKLEGDPKIDNVFDSNKGLELLDYCNDLIDTYGREEASRVFWALYLVYHPESTVWETDLDAKKRQVMKNHMNNDDDFDTLYDQHVTGFVEEIVYDPIAKLLVLARIKFDEYFKAVAYLDFEVKFTEDTKVLNQINNLQDLKGYDAEIEKYEKILKKYENKRDSGKLKANTKESIREKRMRLGKS